MSKKMLHIAGRRFDIAGRPGDPYFDGAADLSPNDFLFKSIRLLPQAPVILDVGANIGVTAALFTALRPATTIYAFEPSPSAVAFLLENVSHNRLNCSVHQFALGASAGMLAFTDNPTSASASHLSIAGATLSGTTHEVRVSTVDLEADRLNLDKVDFIKVDVEGFECDVLSGAKDAIARFRPKMFVEFNSFTMIGFRNINPRIFLDDLLETFPHVYYSHEGSLREIRDIDSQLTFIHNNLIKSGCVDDLLCSFSPCR